MTTNEAAARPSIGSVQVGVILLAPAAVLSASTRSL
jgi:hypothetical protein